MGWFYRALNPRLSRTQVAVRLAVLLSLPLLVPLFGYILSSLLTSPLGLILFLAVVTKLVFMM